MPIGDQLDQIMGVGNPLDRENPSAATASRGVVAAPVSSISSSLDQIMEPGNLEASADEALAADPRRARRNASLADDMGLPDDMVAEDPEFVDRQQQVRATDFEAMGANAPRTAQLMRDPTFMGVAIDDANTLVDLEGWLAPVIKTEKGKSAIAGQATDRVGLLYYKKRTQGLSPDEERRLPMLETFSEYQADSTGEVDKTFNAAFKIGGQVFEGFMDAKDRGLKAAAPAAAGALWLGQMGPQVALPEEVITVPAAAGAAFTAGMATRFVERAFEVETGHAYKEFNELEVDGELIDDETAWFAANVVGTINASLETAGVSMVAKVIPGFRNVVAEMTRKGAAKFILTRPTVRKAFFDFAKSYAGAWGGEVSTEILQEATNIIGQAVLTDESVVGALTDEAGRERLAAVADEVGRGMLVLAGAGGTVNLSSDVNKARRAERVRKTFEVIGEKATESTLKKEAPKRFRKWADHVTKDGPVEKVFVPAGKVDEFFQSQGLDENQVEELLQGLPALKEQMPEARATGNLVEIPIAEWVSNVAGTPLGDVLLDEIKTDVDAYSAREAREFEANVPEELREQYEAARNEQEGLAQTSHQRVRDAIVAEQVQAGTAPDVALANAEQMARVLVNMVGNRAGLDVDEYFEGLGLKVRREVPEVIERLERDELDLLIEKGRQAAQGVEPKLNLGKSMLQHLKESGGVRDHGGELASLDLAKARPGLVRKGDGTAGVDLDTAALDLWEAGFFPEFDERPAINDLVEAMREELAGNARYQKSEEVQAKADEDAATIEELGNFLADRGLTLESDTAQIKAALEQALSVKPAAGDQFQSAFHGTPHRFSKFSLGHLGAGEGVQAYGWGLYFADRKEVAEFYREIAVGEGTGAQQGQVYKAEIPNDDVLMDWDAPLSEQPPAVRAALEKALVEAELARMVVKDATGEDIYYALTDFQAEENTEAKNLEQITSEKLNAIGIKGLKYLDSSTVAKGDDSHNFVIFDDEAIEVVDTFYQSQTPSVTITGDELGALDASVKDLQGKVLDYFRDHLVKRKAVHPVLGEVGFTMGGARKTKDAGANPDKLRVIPALVEVIEKGELLETVPNLDPRKSNIKQYHYLRTLVQINDVRMFVTVTIKEDNSGKLHYNHRVDKDETPSGKFGAPVIESGADLLQGVSDVNIAPEFDGVNIQLQTVGDTTRGKIRMTEEESIISLFRTADLSTFLHESGHLYLNVFKNLATREGADAGIAADWQAIRNWWQENADKLAVEAMLASGERGHPVNVTEGQVRRWLAKGTSGDAWADQMIFVATSEQFARGFEVYLFEGSAPSVEMADLFARFRSWLVAIYRDSKKLNVELSDDMREVFDRMLATADEIAVAEEQMVFAPMAGLDELMSDAERARYAQDAAKAKDEAETKLLKKALAPIKRRFAKWWRKEVTRVRQEVREEVEARPEYRALIYLRTGDLADLNLPEELMGLKFSTSELEELYGREVFSFLPKQVPPIHTKKAHGVHPDVLAEVLGFGSGDELVKTLMNTVPRKKLIEELTDKRLRDEHGDPMVDGTMGDEALAAVHDDERAHFLRLEAEVLARRAGEGKPAPVKVIKAAAARIIAEKATSDAMAFSKYAATAQRMAAQASKALADGDLRAAADFKRKQLLNHELFREARDAKEEVDKALDYFAKLLKPSTLKRIDREYLDQIHTLLERYQLKRSISGPELARRKAYAEWARAEEAKGNQPQYTAALLKALESQEKLDWRKVPLEELRGLRDAVKSIEHIGKLKTKLLNQKDKREFDEVVGALADLIRERGQALPESKNMGPGTGERVKGGLSYAHAHLTRMEFLFRRLDGMEKIGPVWEAMFKPFVDAQFEEAELMGSMAASFKEIFSAYSRSELSKFTRKKWIPEIGKNVTKSEMLAVALNWGNVDNRDALMRGHKWDESQVAAILSHLDKRDWDTVQSVLDAIETLWPMIAKLQKELAGVAPPKVVASEIHTPFGTYRGGYYPLKYDADKSHRQFARDEAASVDQLFENNWLKPQTRSGHTKARQGSGGQAVRLDLGVVAEHTQNVIHDLTHRKAIIDADRLMQADGFRDAVTEVMGKQAYRLFRPWLQSIANEQFMPTTFIDKVFNRMRRGATVFTLGLKITTALKQPLSYVGTIYALGPVSALKGLASFYNPKMIERAEFAKARSKEIKHRKRTFDRDVRDTLKRASFKGLGHEASSFYFIFAGMMDAAAVYPTWLAAYDKGMDQFDGDEAKAIDFADHTVRTTQPAGGQKDLAPVQRSNEFNKLLTMYYSYFSVFYNQYIGDVLIHGTKQRGLVKNVPYMAAATLMLVVLPSILGELTSRHGPPFDEDDAEDPEKWLLKTALKYPFSGIPYVRDVVSYFANPQYGYQITPASDAAKVVVHLAKEGLKAVDPDEEVDTRRLLRGINDTAGYWGGLPTRQIWITGEAFVDWLDGEDVTPGDFAFPRRRR